MNELSSKHLKNIIYAVHTRVTNRLPTEGLFEHNICKFKSAEFFTLMQNDLACYVLLHFPVSNNYEIQTSFEYAGKVGRLALKAAAQVPLKTLVDMARTKEIIFCGYGFNGEVAQLCLINMHRLIPKAFVHNVKSVMISSKPAGDEDFMKHFKQESLQMYFVYAKGDAQAAKIASAKQYYGNVFIIDQHNVVAFSHNELNQIAQRYPQLSKACSIQTIVDEYFTTRPSQIKMIVEDDFFNISIQNCTSHIKGEYTNTYGVTLAGTNLDFITSIHLDVPDCETVQIGGTCNEIRLIYTKKTECTGEITIKYKDCFLGETSMIVALSQPTSGVIDKQGTRTNTKFLNEILQNAVVMSVAHNNPHTRHSIRYLLCMVNDITCNVDVSKEEILCAGYDICSNLSEIEYHIAKVNDLMSKKNNELEEIINNPKTAKDVVVAAKCILKKNQANKDVTNSQKALNKAKLLAQSNWRFSQCYQQETIANPINIVDFIKESTLARIKVACAVNGVNFRSVYKLTPGMVAVGAAAISVGAIVGAAAIVAFPVLFFAEIIGGAVAIGASLVVGSGVIVAITVGAVLIHYGKQIEKNYIITGKQILELCGMSKELVALLPESLWVIEHYVMKYLAKKGINSLGDVNQFDNDHKGFEALFPEFVLKDSVAKVLNTLKVFLAVVQLRNLLKPIYSVGIIGGSKHGKTTLINRLGFNHTGSACINTSEITPCCYDGQENLLFLDYPGNDIQNFADAFRYCSTVPDMYVVVSELQKVKTDSMGESLQMLAAVANKPLVFVLNKADLMNPFSDIASYNAFVTQAETIIRGGLSHNQRIAVLPCCLSMRLNLSLYRKLKKKPRLVNIKDVSDVVNSICDILTQDLVTVNKQVILDKVTTRDAEEDAWIDNEIQLLLGDN